MSKLKRVEQAFYMTSNGIVALVDMDREQLLAVVENLLARQEQDSKAKADLFDLLDSKPPLCTPANCRHGY